MRELVNSFLDLEPEARLCRGIFLDSDWEFNFFCNFCAPQADLGTF